MKGAWRQSLVVWTLIPIALAALAGLYQSAFKPAPYMEPENPDDLPPEVEPVCDLLEAVEDADAAEARRALYTPSPPLGYAGAWRSNYGTLVLLERAEHRVTGFYWPGGEELGRIDGAVDGDGVLRFAWSEGKDNRGQGMFTLKSAPDIDRETGEKIVVPNARLEGSFGYQREEKGGGSWNATRVFESWRPNPSVFDPDSGTLEGIWATDFGPLEIAIDGRSAEGCYRYEHEGVELRGHLEGWFDDGMLIFNWFEVSNREGIEPREGLGMFWLRGTDALGGAWSEGTDRQAGVENWSGWEGLRGRGHWAKPEAY